MKKITGPILAFDNLNVACFDSGELVPELQKSFPELLAEQAEKLGYDLGGVIIETPHGNWRLLRTENGWNRSNA